MSSDTSLYITAYSNNYKYNMDVFGEYLQNGLKMNKISLNLS